MDKDRSIIIQVAAKIAADLTQMDQTTDNKVSEFGAIFTDIKDILLDTIYGDAPVMTPAQAVQNAFPTGNFVNGVSVKNDQQGPLPQWLLDACAKDGVTEVYDNRADLGANPRRPWFKAVNDKEKAYWPPKGA